jgi:hypothetical protein
MCFEMPEIDRDMCRKAAAECVELAQATADPAKKEILLIRSQEWLKLAYSKSETDFQLHLAELNRVQMEESRSPPGQRLPERQPMQQQPMQQQQSRIGPDES